MSITVVKIKKGFDTNGNHQHTLSIFKNTIKVENLKEKLKNKKLNVADLEKLKKSIKRVELIENKEYGISEIYQILTNEKITSLKRIKYALDAKLISDYVFIKISTGETRKIKSSNILKTIKCFQHYENIKLVHSKNGFDTVLCK